MVMKIQGRCIEFIDEVTEYESGRRIAHRTVEGPFPLNTACICEPATGGCRATVVGETDWLVGSVRPVGRTLRTVAALKVDLASSKRSLRGSLGLGN